MINTAFEKNIDDKLRLLDLTVKDKEISSVELRDSVKKFSQKIVRPLDDTADAADAFPHSLWQEFGKQGLKGLIIPKQYGGMGLGNLDLCVAVTELARASGALTVSYVCDHVLCSRQISVFGTEAQKNRYLPKLATGEFVGALAMTEPSAGSDVMSMTTTATKVSGGHIINGSKVFITNGARIDAATGQIVTADVLVLYAKTRREPTRLTAFILEQGMTGFNGTRILKKSTTRGSDNAELTFNDCFVPDENILSTVDNGAHVLMAGLNPERLAFTANTLGVAQAALEEVTEYLVNRQAFGMQIAYNQEVANDIADMYSNIIAAQDHMLMVATQSDIKGEALSNADAASVFLRAAQTALEVTQKARYYYGGNGQTTDYRADRQEGVASLLLVGAGSMAMRKQRLAEHFIPGYASHLKAERSMRAAFKASFGDPSKAEINPNHAVSNAPLPSPA